MGQQHVDTKISNRPAANAAGEDTAAAAVTATAALGRPMGRPDGRTAALGRADVRR